MEKEKLAPGIIDFTEAELLTPDEIQDFGISEVLAAIKSDLEVDCVGLGNRTIPSIIAFMDDICHNILVRTDLLPRMGKIDPCSKTQLRYLSRVYGGVPCFVGVGIGSIDCERRACGIALRADSFTVRFRGIETVHPLTEPGGDPGSSRYRAECLEMIANAYYDGHFEAIYPHLANECRWTSQWMDSSLCGKEAVIRRFERKAASIRAHIFDFDYRIIEIVGPKRGPTVIDVDFKKWPHGHASPGFPCKKGDICLLKIDKTGEQTLMALRFNERHQISRFLVTEERFYLYGDYISYQIQDLVAS